jgi:hypothetical protein
MKSTLAAPFLLLVAILPAQDAPPGPAPELQKLTPMLGNWTGGGVMNEPGGPSTKWTCTGTYAWCLDGHFVQGDFAVRFDGIDGTFVHRTYLGWDRENKRYVAASVNSGGQAYVNELQLLPDGTQVQVSLTKQNGSTYAQRSIVKFAGDVMSHTMHLLLAEGEPLRMIDGKLTRGGDGFTATLDAAAWMGAQAHEQIARLGKSAGVYEVAGEMVMMPGAPPIKIRGTDTFVVRFGGTVLHGKTEGEAEGMPGKYLGDVFWAHDAGRDCISGLYVSNMGEVMQLEARWTPDGKFVATSNALYMGQPTAQRMMMEFAADGAAKSAVNHSIIGTAPPLESFRATYTKKQ